MNDQKIDIQPTSEASADFPLVYRGIKKTHLTLETREIDPYAFLHRPKTDFDGISVVSAPEHCPPKIKFAGIAELISAEICKLLLGIHKSSSTHASITGIPRPKEIEESDKASEEYVKYRDELVYDTELAEVLAGKLAKLAKLID